MITKTSKHTFKIGDRVTCPACDNVPGTVIEIGYNGYTKVQYDDGIIGWTLAADLARYHEQAQTEPVSVQSALTPKQKDHEQEESK